MKRSMAAIFAISILSNTAFSAEPSKNPSIGTWKLNVKESIAPQGVTFRPYTVVIRSAEPDVDWTYHNTDDQGRPIEFTYKGKADGQVRELPGIPGLKGSMTLLPSGIIDAKLWMPDGSYENKFCIMGVTLRRQTCLATVTAPDGSVVFFKQIIDKQD